MKNTSIIYYLDQLTDKRRAEGKRHNLILVLIIVIMATMSQYYGYRAIGAFIRKNRVELLFYLKPAKERLPSYSTIRRVLMKLDFDELAEKFKQWAQETIKIDKQDWISIDGKSIKNTLVDYSSKYQNFVCIVSAFVQKNRMVIGMKKYENKHESEITVVEQMIEMLGVKDVIFSMDALHSKKNDKKDNRQWQ